jgi:hypothetical protein
MGTTGVASAQWLRAREPACLKTVMIKRRLAHRTPADAARARGLDEAAELMEGARRAT